MTPLAVAETGPGLYLATGFSWWVVAAMVLGMMQCLGMGGLVARDDDSSDEEKGAAGCASVVAMVAVLVIGITWMVSGPFATAWVLVPFMVIGLLTMFAGPRAAQAGCGLIMLAGIAWGVSIGVAHWQQDKTETVVNEVKQEKEAEVREKEEQIRQREEEIAQLREEVEEAKRIARKDTRERPVVVFWPEEMVRDEAGFLMTERTYIPIRAIARYPNVPFFASQELAFPDGVIGIMQTWVPHYVFEKQGEALLVGVSASTPEGDRRWVRQADCFCWTTRECLNIDRPVSIYASREDLERRQNPLGTYDYPYAKHFVSGQDGDERQRFRMASLPVLRQVEGRYWCFVRPEGSDHGYQTCWLEWDGESDLVQCRVRATRREFDEYVLGVRRLMIEYKNPEKRTTAKMSLHDQGQAWLTVSQEVGDRERVKSRLQGVPKLDGFLASPIEHPLQYDKMNKQILALLNLGMQDIWDVNDVAYIPLGDLP